MNKNKKILIYILLGACAGLISFSAVEFTNLIISKSYIRLTLVQGAFLGLSFGLIFGFTDGIIYKELKSGLFKAAVSGAAGSLIAAFSVFITSQGMLITINILNPDYSSSMKIILPLWRGFGWMLMGAAIGAIDGIVKMTIKKTTAGILGGMIGGLSGGLVFEFAIRYFPENPIICAAGLIIMGLLLGFFFGAFEKRFSYGRLRILNGSLKDREYILIKNKTVIGPSLHHDIYLHGYKSISECSLTRVETEILLQPLSPKGTEDTADKEDLTVLNDRPLDEKKYLKYQDVIQLGSLKMIYLPA